MNLGETGYFISKGLVYLFLWVASIYGVYAICYAYFKTKDEREKYIVLRSTTNAFGLSLVLFVVSYFVEISVNIANVKQLTMLWDLLHFGLESGPAPIVAVSTMMTCLGICLFFNKRKAGGD